MSISIYYDRAAVAMLFEQMRQSIKVFGVPRRLPRPWPTFCGQSLDNRPIVFVRDVRLEVVRLWENQK